jgi:hypothetical protein
VIWKMNFGWCFTLGNLLGGECYWNKWPISCTSGQCLFGEYPAPRESDTWDWPYGKSGWIEVQRTIWVL